MSSGSILKSLIFVITMFICLYVFEKKDLLVLLCKERLQKKTTADLVTLSKKGGRGQEKGKI